MVVELALARFNVVSLVSILPLAIILLLIVVLPVLAPTFKEVAAPAKLIVVAIVFAKLNVAEFEIKSVALISTLALATTAVACTSSLGLPAIIVVIACGLLL